MSFGMDCRDRGAPGFDGHDLAQRLMATAADLGADELRVLLLVAERLAKGRQRYGELELGSDRRDFSHESLEEIADALVYAACALVRGRA